MAPIGRWAGPAAGAAAADLASSVPAVMSARSLRIASGEIVSNWRDASRATRARLSSETNAQSRWPERTSNAPNSIEATIQASRTSFTRSGESAGLRELPVLR